MLQIFRFHFYSVVVSVVQYNRHSSSVLFPSGTLDNPWTFSNADRLKHVVTILGLHLVLIPKKVLSKLS